MNWSKRCLGLIGIAAIAILNGWHLVPVQTFAWATMAMDDANQSQTFPEALSIAIEGESKCPICHYVEEQNFGSDDVSLIDTLPKLIFLSPNLTFFSISPPTVWTLTVYRQHRLGSWTDIVETPPPVKELQLKASVAI